MGAGCCERLVRGVWQKFVLAVMVAWMKVIAIGIESNKCIKERLNRNDNIQRE